MKDMTSNWSQCLGRLMRATGAGVIALSLVASGTALAGIANTRHNLSTTNALADSINVTAGTADICVFCHTPHSANLAVAAPLWNKQNSAPVGGYTTFSTASSSTIDGTVLPVGSVSLACLSCHDGTQAMDNIINAPGSGGVTNGGGAGGLTTFTWDAVQAPPRVSAAGNMLAASAAMVGTDLTNDHPIGIQYCGGGITTAATAGPCRDTDFRPTQNATINTQLVWWVDTGAAGLGARGKSDMILYSRSFGGVVGPSVECASCHDPHVEGGTGVAGATFLRVSNAGSAVCLACHNK